VRKISRKRRTQSAPSVGTTVQKDFPGRTLTV
jgi:hypothetical protein